MRLSPFRARVARLALVAGLGLALIGGAHPAGATPWFGVRLQTVPADVREKLGLPTQGGVLVDQVLEGSPAERANLRAGDVVLRVNGRAVASPQELLDAIRTLHEGAEVPVELVRQREQLELLVQVGKRPEGGPLAQQPQANFRARPGDDGRPWVFWDFQNLNGTTSRYVGALDAIPDAELRELLDILGSGGAIGRWERAVLISLVSARVRLGVHTSAISGGLAAAMGTPELRGALVTEVLPGTTAKAVGLRSGDVIVAVNGRAIDGSSALDAHLNALDDHASLSVWHSGRRREYSVALVPRPLGGPDVWSGARADAPSWVEKSTISLEEATDPGWQRRLQHLLFDRHDLANR